MTNSLDVRLRGVVVLHILCTLRYAVDVPLTHKPPTADLGLMAGLCYPWCLKPKNNTDLWRLSQGRQDIRERFEGSLGSKRCVKAVAGALQPCVSAGERFGKSGRTG